MDLTRLDLLLSISKWDLGNGRGHRRLACRRRRDQGVSSYLVLLSAAVMAVTAPLWDCSFSLQASHLLLQLPPNGIQYSLWLPLAPPSRGQLTQGWLVSPFAGPWLSHHILVNFIKPTLAECAFFLPVSRIIHQANRVYRNILVMEKQCLYFKILHSIPISSALLCNRFTSWSRLQDQIPSLALIVGFLENFLYMIIIRGSKI